MNYLKVKKVIIILILILSTILIILLAHENLWDAFDSHHVLPVFAAARAFVPSSFESLLGTFTYLLLYTNIITNTNMY